MPGEHKDENLRACIAEHLYLLLESRTASRSKPPLPPKEPSTPEAIKQFNDDEDQVAAISKQIVGKEDQPR
jgi:hypothetical protein